MEEKRIDFVAALQDECNNTGMCLFCDILDEDEQLKTDTMNFLQKTGENIDQIIFGAVGLGMYLLERLHPDLTWDEIADWFREYWIDDVTIHDGMTNPIDAALDRARIRLEAEKEEIETKSKNQNDEAMNNINN